MIMFVLKLLKSIKAAIAGRKHPHQLAGGVAFGFLLGVVPHGNLLAVAILLVVLTLRINHAMAGITAIGITYVATKLDPYSHRVGDYILSNENWSEQLTAAWQLPLIPWTDLNNTVVMGSFVIGLVALLPIFMLTYPVFNLFAASAKKPVPKSSRRPESLHANQQEAALPQEADASEPTESPEEQPAVEPQPAVAASKSTPHSIVLVDQGTSQVDAPHVNAPSRFEMQTENVVRENEAADAASEQLQTVQLRIDPASQNEVEDAVSELENEKHVSVETRIDVIRLRDYQDNQTAETSSPTKETVASDAATPPNDEALNYLLRQLRDSQQQRKAG